MEDKTISVDCEIIEIYCKSVCTRRQEKCPACTFYKIVMASKLKTTDKLTATEAIDRVLDDEKNMGRPIKGGLSDRYITHGGV